VSDNALPTIRNVIFFQGLDEAALDVIAAAATHRQLAEEAFLFHEGEAATAFFVLQEGRVRLSQITEDGKQVILGFLGECEGVGIIAALPHAEYPLSAQATEACTLLAWDSLTLQHLMERYPVIAYHTLRMLAGRFVELQTRYRELATERVERRIARAVLRLTQQAGRQQASGVLIDMPLSRQDIADMTGTTLYTVSRTLSQWEQRSIIETGREWVRVCLPHELVSIAEDLPPESPTTPDPPACLR
jgi:CRP-like cAMP-binding protein